jgi:hypothetical protein
MWRLSGGTGGFRLQGRSSKIQTLLVSVHGCMASLEPILFADPSLAGLQAAQPTVSAIQVTFESARSLPCTPLDTPWTSRLGV